MNWIAPYRDAIAAQAAALQHHGYSWIGEDDHGIQFTDGEVLVSFCVQRYEDALEVLVRHLGDQADDVEYRLDLVMRVMDGATTQDFRAESEGERQELVARYVKYLLDNKQRLFGPQCSYGEAYSDFNRTVMARLMAQWAPKA